ncbi:acylneuraminate cytidylyltransferase family protein [Piscinibacter terrae]|uniref:Acylneuraminate cytidylyltransferase family protein n=1 Tax=Piscinibacter terrae TaxID=2496871 RepID=A0A3N7HLZ3_9BURK|nr:acylneuraminate cytidylyltransferase family protein [Albitalea terrae]RQP21621.1 acylneuraminate cytidylyltransferase family protein [Albitalea terrae]
MIDGKRVLALVPARRGSKGLPMKNIRLLHGKPLLAWPIEAASGSTLVDRVVISTEDPEFAAIAQRAGADAPFLRPAELANDTAPSIGFILHALDTLEAAGDAYDYLVLLEPTSPLTETSDVDAALRQLHARRNEADAIVGVSALVSTHPAFAVRENPDGLIEPFSAPTFGQLPRRQDIEPLYALDGSLYISDVDTIRREKGFCHQRTLPYVTPRFKSFEVDDLVDFICIEALLAQRELVSATNA